MFQILILTFLSLAHQQTPKFNFSQFNDSLKMKQIDYLTKFIDLEKSMNLTTKQAQENANFALELWVNTENFLNQSTQQIHNQSILNIINNEQFQNIIPQDQEGMQATEKYIEQWQNQTDVDKSIILQYVIENINEMIQSEDPSNYNQTNLIERISNQTLILDQNKQNINTSKYIFPITWQHANVSQEEMILANFYYNTKHQNLTVQEEFDKLSAEEIASLISAFDKFFINPSKNPTTNISSKGEQPIEKPEELPLIQSNDNNEDHNQMYLVISSILFLLIVIMFLIRRYLIQKKLALQLNEESNAQGLQA